VNPVSFTVHGTPVAGGSKRGFVNRNTGRVIITDASDKARPWKALVRDAAVQAMTCHDETPIGTHGYLPPLEGPLLLEVTFWMPRPKSHFGTGKRAGILKPAAPRFHTVKPDTTKLLRLIEDSLTGVVWRDDSQVATQIAQKVYGEPARCEVRVVPIAQDTVEGKHRELRGVESATTAQLPLEALERGAA